LCADADPDGQAIKNLLLTCFWSLCPELVVNGHIYAAIPPLFRITTKKNEYIYLRDAAALEEYKAKHQGEKFQVNRNKGLGEQDAEELEECLLNPETRNVEQITVSDVVETSKLFEIFMGPSVGPRKDWIMAHSEEANDL
jgi:DNA gyrase subunit B